MEFAGHSVGNEIPWVELLGPVCSNAVEYPSWVTPPLLEAVARLADKLDRPELKDWPSLWTRHERARRVYQDARHHGWRSGPLWILSSNVAWLAIADSPEPDPWIVCTSESVLGQEFDAVWRRTGNLPAYFGAGVIVASRQYRLTPDRLTGQWQPNEIARRGASDFPRAQASGSTADRALDADEDEAIRLAGTSTTHSVLGVLGLEIFLDNPSLLFARQRTRTYWFAALIAASAAAALVGLVSAWRAFHRQELLAQMQSQFVSSVSHELRAPIASIRLLAEGLELGRVRAADKQAEYFSLMGQECRRLTALIENVLDFSRIEQGRKQFEFESTDVRALVLQTVRLMEPQAAERQVTLTIDFRDADHGLQIIDHGTTYHGTTGVCLQPCLDGRAIQQALVNLIDNAIKHAPPNSTVEVGLAFERPVRPVGNDTVPGSPDAAVPLRIWVRDSGEGIPAAEHEKIFEPFYRRGTELRRETTGIGIGLTIVRHIVEAHGGRVTVESEPGHGSKFTLHIP
jgi:signal transduction histidine kinase